MNLISYYNILILACCVLLCGCDPSDEDNEPDDPTKNLSDITVTKSTNVIAAGQFVILKALTPDTAKAGVTFTWSITRGGKTAKFQPRNGTQWDIFLETDEVGEYIISVTSHLGDKTKGNISNIFAAPINFGMGKWGNSSREILETALFYSQRKLPQPNDLPTIEAKYQSLKMDFYPDRSVFNHIYFFDRDQLIAGTSYVKWDFNPLVNQDRYTKDDYSVYVEKKAAMDAQFGQAGIVSENWTIPPAQRINYQYNAQGMAKAVRIGILTINTTWSNGNTNANLNLYLEGNSRTYVVANYRSK